MFNWLSYSAFVLPKMFVIWDRAFCRFGSLDVVTSQIVSETLRTTKSEVSSQLNVLWLRILRWQLLKTQSVFKCEHGTVCINYYKNYLVLFLGKIRKAKWFFHVVCPASFTQRTWPTIFKCRQAFFTQLALCLHEREYPRQSRLVSVKLAKVYANTKCLFKLLNCKKKENIFHARQRILRS